MAIWAMADLHLSLGTDKPMDIFKGWDNYFDRLESNWRAVVGKDDVVVIPGDISWAMSLESAESDLRFIHSLPGKKVIIKGNHDYWWNTKRKMDNFLAKKSFDSISVLFNNAYRFGDVTVCGSRGWFFDAEDNADKKVLLREAGRLRMSITEGKKLGGNLIAFLHYPPVTKLLQCEEIINVLKEEGVERCIYGHLHGASVHNAFIGEKDGIKFDLVSADYLKFCPKLIEKF